MEGTTHAFLATGDTAQLNQVANAVRENLETCAAAVPILADLFAFEERRSGIQLMRRGTMFADFLDVGLNPNASLNVSGASQNIE